MKSRYLGSKRLTLSRLRRKSTAVVLAAALTVAQSHVQAAEAASHRVDLREYLHEEQQAWWDQDVRAKALLCGRRAGKSILLAHWLVDGAIDAPRNSICAYISLTRKSAEENLWIPIKDAAKKSGVRHKVNEAKLTITFEGGGRVMLAGSDKLAEIEKFRGKAIIRAAVDECGAMKPSLLQYLHRDVLHPATLDYGGQLAFAGTPGYTLDGYWWEMTRKGSEMGIPVKHWTCRSNPFLKDPEGFLQETLDDFGWTEDVPTFQREYLGVWVQDIGDLVFPLDKDKNRGAELPTHNGKGYLLDPKGWRYVIGVDVGVVDHTAIVVVACHSDLPAKKYILSSEKHEKWLIAQLAHRLRELRKDYPSAVVVLDTGGMGKSHSEELRRNWSIHHEAAEKSEKASNVRTVRDDLISGNIVVLEGARNDALIQEWESIGWDSKREMPHPSAEDHASDAALYALRRLRHYTKTEKAPGPQPGSEEWAAQEAERMRKARIKQQAQRQKNRGRTQWRS